MYVGAYLVGGNGDARETSGGFVPGEVAEHVVAGQG